MTAFTAAAAGTNAGADLLLPLLEATAAAAAAAAEADVGFAEPATAVGVFGATVDWVAGLLAGGACDTTEGAAAALGEGAAAAAAAAAAAVGPFSPLGGGVDLIFPSNTSISFAFAASLASSERASAPAAATAAAAAAAVVVATVLAAVGVRGAIPGLCPVFPATAAPGEPLSPCAEFCIVFGEIAPLPAARRAGGT